MPLCDIKKAHIIGTMISAGRKDFLPWQHLKLIEALQALAHERKIDEFYLIERLEASLANSYQRILDLEYDARVTIDRNTGKIYVYELVPVGEPDEETGEYTEFEERDVTPDDVSRIAALNAKNVIGSIVRDAGSSVYL